MTDLSESTGGIPWSRYLVEGGVIVGSILLAFAIDAWWEDRSEQALEREFLVNTLDSIRGALNEGHR